MIARMTKVTNGDRLNALANANKNIIRKKITIGSGVLRLSIIDHLRLDVLWIHINFAKS